MRQTGIYKITNLINGKFYIGQSRDIFTRWKAHTMALTEHSNESIIRMAFAKYNLREQVNKKGVFGNFNFEIIENCDAKKLIERETYYINKLKPQYNVQLMGINPIFPKRDLQKTQCFLQYHSFERMGYIPGESDDDSITTENANYGIFTKKRVAINMLGSSVVLIFGGKPKSCRYNRYYLWSELVVEDIQFDHEYKQYILQGIENLMDTPIDLTDLYGFDEFKIKCGNFAYGLQSMKNKDFFHKIILPLITNHKLSRVISYNKWIDDFLEREHNIYNPLGVK
ncbi:MAG: GIY-YIG nuclease family protein [Desulfamplus sp.]|nr:GIY-YIG nuclease family protein [Desulfamplus sp.]